ncbi:MAG: hypothetical protein [Podoviridae sp. ctQNx1]|nr:MAG: hypothetical protein [Podoviridae sp. ctQNx1]UOF78120.1 hypothetical protein [Caudoviricetes sp.]
MVGKRKLAISLGQRIHATGEDSVNGLLRI